MDPTTVLITATVLLVAWLLVKRSFERRRVVELVNRIPGPPTIPLLGNALSCLVPRNRFAEFVKERTKKYSPLYRIWLGPLAEIHITRPEHAQVFLSSGTQIEKSIIYTFLWPWLGTGLITGTGSQWRTHRKLITPAFNSKVLESFTEVFVETAEVLVNKLQKEVAEKGDKGFDIYPFVTRCALDNICLTAMGSDVRAQDDVDSGYVQAVVEVSESLLYRMFRPWLHVDFLFNWTNKGKKFHSNLKILHSFTDKVIQERKAEYLQKSKQIIQETTDENLTGSKRRLAFLDLLLDASQDGVRFSDLELREEVDTLMFAGHDTTAASIAWTLYLLGTHEDIQKKVIEELDSLYLDSHRPITVQDLSELKYLERVIKESLRLYPSVPFIGRVLDQDLQCGEYLIPAGCAINIEIFHIHRCPDQFPNPETFDPDNFLPDRMKGRHPYAYIPFSAGLRNCIGQKFAMMEMKIVLTTLLRHFTVRSLEKEENLTLMFEIVMRPPESGMQLVLTPR